MRILDVTCYLSSHQVPYPILSSHDQQLLVSVKEKSASISAPSIGINLLSAKPFAILPKQEVNVTAITSNGYSSMEQTLEVSSTPVENYLKPMQEINKATLENFQELPSFERGSKYTPYDCDMSPDFSSEQVRDIPVKDTHEEFQNPPCSVEDINKTHAVYSGHSPDFLSVPKLEPAEQSMQHSNDFSLERAENTRSNEIPPDFSSVQKVRSQSPDYSFPEQLVQLSPFKQGELSSSGENVSMPHSQKRAYSPDFSPVKKFKSNPHCSPDYSFSEQPTLLSSHIQTRELPYHVEIVNTCNSQLSEKSSEIPIKLSSESSDFLSSMNYYSQVTVRNSLSPPVCTHTDSRVYQSLQPGEYIQLRSWEMPPEFSSQSERNDRIPDHTDESLFQCDSGLENQPLEHEDAIDPLSNFEIKQEAEDTQRL